MQDLPGLTLEEIKDNVYEYAYNHEKSSMQDILKALSCLSGIEDVELKRAPIEEVIAKLYRSWK